MSFNVKYTMSVLPTFSIWKCRWITINWDLLVLCCAVEFGLEPVFWFPKVVKRAVFWWCDNPTQSACWYTRSRIRIAEVIACTRPTAFALFMARTHYRSNLKHQLRGLQTSEISVWSSSTIYLEVSRSRIRVWLKCNKSGINLTGWRRSAKNIETSKTWTPEVLRRGDGGTSWKSGGCYCMWKGRLLGLVVTLVSCAKNGMRKYHNPRKQTRHET